MQFLRLAADALRAGTPAEISKEVSTPSVGVVV